jgi:soluble lytic murein transglycosylase-like protein
MGAEVSSHAAPPPVVYDALVAASNATGVPVALLAGVAWVESRYNARAQSKTGARGLMQLSPAIIARYAVQDVWSPAQSAMAAAKLLRELHQRFGVWSLACAAYNQGGAATERFGVLEHQPESVRKYVINVWEAQRRIPLPFLPCGVSGSTDSRVAIVKTAEVKCLAEAHLARDSGALPLLRGLLYGAGGEA